MLLVAGPSPEFLKFIQILTWIVLPVLASAIIITIYLHYKKKRRNAQTDVTTDEDFMLANPELVGYTKGDGEYILFDHSPLIREYKDRLLFHHARYSALQHDFGKLESRYALLIDYASFSFDTDSKHKKHTMENPQMAVTPGSLEPMAEHDYLKDLLTEKKAQIEFLQSQLEQRIVHQHHAEQQRMQALSEKEDVLRQMKELQAQVDSLQQDLLGRQEEADKLQVKICQQEEQLEARQENVHSKQDQITYLENQLKEAREQNELLNATAADHRDQALALQQQLSDEQSRNQYIEEKLSASKQAMRRIYKEFSSFMDTDGEPSPVISLRPDYITRETEETAVH